MNKTLAALLFLCFLPINIVAGATKEEVELAISGAFDASEFDNREKLALAWSVLATAADVYTSARGQRGGCSESGALYGDHTDALDYVIPTLLITGAQLYIYKRPDMPKAHWFGWIYGSFRMVGAIHNAQLDCYGR